MGFSNDVFNRNEFLIGVSKGNVAGQSFLSIAGCNTDIDIISGEEDLWEEGGTLVYLSSAETMDVVSTSLDDDVGGTGATGVFISGNLGGVSVSEVVALDGTTPVTTTQTFDVVNFMFLTSSGSGLTNAGDITATASTALTVQCKMQAGIGITQHGFYRVPTGRNAVIQLVEMNATKTGGGASPILDYKLYARFSPTSPWIVLLERKLDVNVQDSLIIPFPLGGVLSAGADIRLAASTDQNNTECLLRVTAIEYDV